MTSRSDPDTSRDSTRNVTSDADRINTTRDAAAAYLLRVSAFKCLPKESLRLSITMMVIRVKGKKEKESEGRERRGRSAPAVQVQVVEVVMLSHTPYPELAFFRLLKPSI